jgi:Zn-dependent M32 family carboxypeptidase|tara:strand:+ start:865 stop:1194 length:330 start_codon:yes stop_codon:yes gene_type:complete
MAVATNYTEEQVEMMRARYQEEPTRETVENLAEELNKSIKSIIGKLSREGIYQKAIYKTKTGEIPITKSQLIQKIADLLEIDSSKIMGLEKAPKQDIKYLYEVLGGSDG